MLAHPALALLVYAAERKEEGSGSTSERQEHGGCVASAAVAVGARSVTVTSAIAMPTTAALQATVCTSEGSSSQPLRFPHSLDTDATLGKAQQLAVTSTDASASSGIGHTRQQLKQPTDTGATAAGTDTAASSEDDGDDISATAAVAVSANKAAAAVKARPVQSSATTRFGDSSSDGGGTLSDTAATSGTAKASAAAAAAAAGSKLKVAKPAVKAQAPPTSSAATSAQ
jgi:hypothetical protein